MCWFGASWLEADFRREAVFCRAASSYISRCFQHRCIAMVLKAARLWYSCLLAHEIRTHVCALILSVCLQGSPWYGWVQVADGGATTFGTMGGCGAHSEAGLGGERAEPGNATTVAEGGSCTEAVEGEELLQDIGYVLLPAMEQGARVVAGNGRFNINFCGDLRWYCSCVAAEWYCGTWSTGRHPAMPQYLKHTSSHTLLD